MEQIDRRTVIEATPGLFALLFLALSGGVDPDGIAAWIRGDPDPAPRPLERPRRAAREVSTLPGSVRGGGSAAASADSASAAASPAGSSPAGSGTTPLALEIRAEEASAGSIRFRSAPLPPPEPVNLNRASKAELVRLPGIGPVKAAAILSVRAARGGRFDSWEDVGRVPGIGPKTLERIRREAVLW